MIRIGIMSFAHMHAASYASAISQAPHAELASIADDDRERGERMAAQFGVPYAQSYAALLRQHIDAVVVTSENVRHREMVTMAAEAGKHVLCEKPLATTVDDARAMIEVCRANGVQLMTAFPCRYSQSAVRLREAVQSGALGDLLAIRATNRGKCPGGWFVDPAKSGGGAVMDHTVHVADLMRWILESEASEIYAEISNGMHGADFDDCGLLSIAFANGVFATLDTSWSRPRSFPIWGDVTMEVVGSRGTISVDLFAQNLTHYSDKTMSASMVSWGDNLDELMIADFASAIADGYPVSVSGEDGLRAMEIALAAYRSADGHSTVGLGA